MAVGGPARGGRPGGAAVRRRVARHSAAHRQPHAPGPPASAHADGAEVRAHVGTRGLAFNDAPASLTAPRLYGCRCMWARDEWRPSAEALERLASEDLRVPLDVPHTAPAYDPGRPWTQHEIRANCMPSRVAVHGAVCGVVSHQRNVGASLVRCADSDPATESADGVPLPAGWHSGPDRAAHVVRTGGTHGGSTGRKSGRDKLGRHPGRPNRRPASRHQQRRAAAAGDQQPRRNCSR